MCRDGWVLQTGILGGILKPVFTTAVNLNSFDKAYVQAAPHIN